MDGRLTREGEWWWEARCAGTDASETTGCLEEGIRCLLTFGGVRVGDGINHALRLLLADLCWQRRLVVFWHISEGGRGSCTVVVVDDVAKVISSAVMRLPDAHRVVREVHIAVIAWELLELRAFASAVRIPTEEWALLAGISNRKRETYISAS